MKLWRIHLKPASKKGIDTFDHCLRNGIVGIGWPASCRPRNWKHYMVQGEEKYGDKAWRQAANAIGPEGMQVGDLAWCRNTNGDYYIGRIEDEWEYRDDEESLRADIVNVRRCKLHYVGKQVIGAIVNCFIPAATVQQIHDKTALLFSIVVFNDVANDHLPLKDPGDVDLFSLLTADGLEDVVGLYLQLLKGLVMVPSSCKKSTPAFEYMLVAPNTGRFAYVQVKGGKVQLDPAEYYKEHADMDIYLFSPNGYKRKSANARVVCLTKDEITRFVKLAKSIMPLNISWAVSLWCRLRKNDPRK